MPLHMRVVVAAFLLCVLGAFEPNLAAFPEETNKMTKLTPVLYVEAIEPCLSFWVDRLGFEKTAEVPEGSRLGFVILVKDNAEVMLQTYESGEKDVPALAGDFRKSANFLFVEVSNLDEIIAKLDKASVVMPMRTTFYGMREIAVREPGGHVVCFAQKQ
jgi:uncharacterized glyoxalase superfamily protein PhnB